MPTVFLLLVALCDLRLSAELVGLRVRAKLTNTGDEPVSVLIGDSCAGPLFKLVVDGKPRPFVGTGRVCGTPHLYGETVPAHGEFGMLSDSLDGRHHRVRVTLRNLSSETIEVPTVVRVDVAVAATAKVRAGQPVVVEVTHVNRSAEAVVLPTCGEDRLLIDGKERPLGDKCVAREVRMVPVRGAWVTRALVGGLAPGPHKLRARWRDSQSQDVEVDVE